MEATIVVRFTQSERYPCAGVVHSYREGESYRFIADFAQKWLHMGSAVEVADDPAIKLTTRPGDEAPEHVALKTERAMDPKDALAAAVPQSDLPKPAPAPAPATPTAQKSAVSAARDPTAKP
jgi:hypothetical protein